MNPLLALAGSYLLAEAYERYTSPQFKASWHNAVRSHHGEWGILGTLLGILTGSPALTSAGLGLAYHDRKDAGKWFKGKIDIL